MRRYSWKHEIELRAVRIVCLSKKLVICQVPCNESSEWMVYEKKLKHTNNVERARIVTSVSLSCQDRCNIGTHFITPTNKQYHRRACLFRFQHQGDVIKSLHSRMSDKPEANE